MSKNKEGKSKFPKQIYVTLDKDGSMTYVNAGTEPEWLLGDEGDATLIGTYTFESKSKMRLTRTVEVL